MTKLHGVPTFPIFDGMCLGKRDADEIEWLLEHGYLRSSNYAYSKIIKHPGRERPYVLYEVSGDGQSEEIDDFRDLDVLLKTYDLERQIELWRWYGETTKDTIDEIR